MINTGLNDFKVFILSSNVYVVYLYFLTFDILF